jgi:hypothetical protein
MSAVNIVVFVGNPLMGVWGFLMFRFPETWAKINARFSDKKFHSPKQLATTKLLGILVMLIAAFSSVSILAMGGLVLK